MAWNAENARVDFNVAESDVGEAAIIRRRADTMDAAHQSPQSVGTNTDTSVTLVVQPINGRELQRMPEGRINSEDAKAYCDGSVDILEGDIVFLKSDEENGQTTIAGTNATTAVVVGNVLNLFDKDSSQINKDYVSISDADNDGLYKISAAVYSSPNTTLTIAFAADPSTGDILYPARVFSVEDVEPWPRTGTTAIKKILLRHITT